MATPTVDVMPPGSRAAGFTITLGLAVGGGKALRWTARAAMDCGGVGLRLRAGGLCCRAARRSRRARGPAGAVLARRASGQAVGTGAETG